MARIDDALGDIVERDPARPRRTHPKGRAADPADEAPASAARHPNGDAGQRWRAVRLDGVRQHVRRAVSQARASRRITTSSAAASDSSTPSTASRKSSRARL